MTAHAMHNGWPIEYRSNWVYSDSGVPVEAGGTWELPKPGAVPVVKAKHAAMDFLLEELKLATETMDENRKLCESLRNVIHCLAKQE